MANWFNRQLKFPKIKKSYFDLSHDVKTSIGIGELVPTQLLEVLPGDRFDKLHQNMFLRLSPLVYPLMHRMRVKTSTFFAPIRIVMGFENYQKWLNNEVDIMPLRIVTDEEGDDRPSHDYVFNLFKNSIFDYLGIDITQLELSQNSVGNWYLSLPNPIPYLSYLLICRDWYADETLQADYISAIDDIIRQYQASYDTGVVSSVFFNDDGIPNTFRVSYSRDYFTSAQPTPVKGPEQYVLNRPLTVSTLANNYENLILDDNKLVGIDSYEPINENTTIRDLWRKEMLQRFYEVDNTFGTRIREKLAGHFGVDFSDKSIPIARYLGGDSVNVQVSEVIQTSSSTEDSALGTFAGKATALAKSSAKPFNSEEHGFIFSFVSLIPDTGYCNGSSRFWFKQNFFDFASPEFNNIGWQDVYKGEVLSHFNESDSGRADKNTFAYQPRYSEYRSERSRVCGDFRTDALLPWHMARKYISLPPFNSDFIKIQQSDVNRIFSIESSANDKPIFLDCWNDTGALRPISYEPDALHLY